MPADLTVVLDDSPGQLAALGEATGRAGVNIEGMCATTGEGRGVVHLLVEDAGAGSAALEDAGIEVADRREVLVIDVANRPGTLGEVARTLAEAGVNVDLAYTTFGGVRVVIATDDMASAKAALA